MHASLHVTCTQLSTAPSTGTAPYIAIGMLAEILSTYPDISARDEIIAAFDEHFTEEKMRGEAAYFDRKLSSNYERTYGWAWLIKLSEQLHHLAEHSTDKAHAREG